ncbi:MAG TPA: hypothetical protein VMT05_13340 [Terriglobales bacterium]|jgi:hypothetical protein|nr:hypothetical protein [Terriglobales bacterium]
MPSDAMTGSAIAFMLYDVAEEIRIDQLRQTSGIRRAEGPSKHPTPEYVGFQRPPVILDAGEHTLASGDRVRSRVKFYDYGVVSILLETPFQGDWRGWIELASRWMASGEFEQYARELARQYTARLGSALVKPYDSWLWEDYFVFHVAEIPGTLLASDLIACRGNEVAQIVRGETCALAEGEKNEILQARMSYYPRDLAVIGWHGAFLYDTPAGAQTAIELLEYSNSQLLEFRHYDELLTRELQAAYKFLERGSPVIHRWRLAREGARLERVTIDVTELTERADNAIKFLSDMFSARLYNLAATKVGVNDYKLLVEEKLRTATSLYSFMIGEFHQARAFVLELMIVIILIIDLIFLFRGKS